MTVDTLTKRLAIIDIGSNSIRLVVYDLKAPGLGAPLLNEKIQCQLGRGLARDNKLDPEDQTTALNALQWFALLLDGMPDTHLRLIATEALRQAENGPAFQTQITELFGQRVEVISGLEEARLAAMGVGATIPHSNGLVADQGGGSLELCLIDANRIEPLTSLPYGVLRLKARQQQEGRSALELAEALGRGLPTLSKGQSLYLVGGTWRALALLHMNMHAYPLEVVHRYALTHSEAHRFASQIAGVSEPALARLPVEQERRRAYVPVAAAMLLALIDQAQPEEIVFSSAGIREGILADWKTTTSPETLASLSNIIRQGQQLRSRLRFAPMGDALFEWVQPLLAQMNIPDASSPPVRRLACSLADWGWQRHPGYKEGAAWEILASKHLTLSHSERVFCALALLARHHSGKKPIIAEKLLEQDLLALLSQADQQEALVMGAAFRLALKVSGGLGSILQQTSLTKTNHALILTAPISWQGMSLKPFESASRTLTKILNQPLEVRFCS